jgi:hypothetical protein
MPIAGFVVFVVLLAAVTTVLGGPGTTLVAFAFLLVLAVGTIGLSRLLSR